LTKEKNVGITNTVQPKSKINTRHATICINIAFGKGTMDKALFRYCNRL